MRYKLIGILVVFFLLAGIGAVTAIGKKKSEADKFIIKMFEPEDDPEKDKNVKSKVSLKEEVKQLKIQMRKQDNEIKKLYSIIYDLRRTVKSLHKYRPKRDDFFKDNKVDMPAGPGYEEW